MKKFGLITNKYVVSVLILLCLFIADIILHRDMSRAIIRSSFPAQIKPVNLPLCERELSSTDKHWIKAVNSLELMNKITSGTAGIQCDVNFNLSNGHFEMYPDANTSHALDADSLLALYTSRKLVANVLFDLKNISAENLTPALEAAIKIKNTYGLSGKLIVESSHPKFLQPFCDSGFFTSYSVPAFDPYKATENETIHFIDSVRKMLSQYPASAISCIYFQYPVLKKFFPNYPLLTWVDHASLSVVSYVFKRQLENDDHIKVILSPPVENSYW